MAQALKRVALIVGSSRTGGNGAGLASWLSPIIQRRVGPSHEVIVVDPTKPPRPFGPVVDGVRMPSQIHNPADYASEDIRNWSSLVSSCSAFVILTPEYNAGYPGELKNAIDHIFFEWRDKAAMVVSYGSGGGARCAVQLKQVLENVKLKQISKSVQIKLPKEFTRGEERVPVGEAQFPEFLTEYVQSVEEAAGELVDLLKEVPESKP